MVFEHKSLDKQVLNLFISVILHPSKVLQYVLVYLFRHVGFYADLSVFLCQHFTVND